MPALEERLRHVVRQDDKSVRDETAQWMGNAARFLDPDWYARVLDAWDRIVHHKPGYYLIAWSAVLNDAPAHALQAARLAAKTFADDPAFQEELAFIERLLAVR